MLCQLRHYAARSSTCTLSRLRRLEAGGRIGHELTVICLAECIDVLCETFIYMSFAIRMYLDGKDRL